MPLRLSRLWRRSTPRPLVIPGGVPLGADPMGCGVSAPKTDDTGVDGAPAGPAGPATPPASGDAAPSPASVSPPPAPAPSRRSGSARTRAAGAAATTYDTPTSASYSVDGGGGGNPFFGLLARDDAAVGVNVDVHHETKSRVVRAVSPFDDSCVAGGAATAAPSGRDGLGGVAALRDAPADNDAVPLALTGVAMTLPYVVLVGGASDAHRPALQALIDGVFANVHARLDNWNPASEIARLAAAPVNKKVPMSAGLAGVLSIVDRVHDLSGGRFDPTVAPVAAFWRAFVARTGRPPVAAEVAHLRHAVGWRTRVKRLPPPAGAVAPEGGFGGCGGTAWRCNGNTGIDLGGVAKGHAVDLLVAALTGTGWDNVYVDWGADVAAVGGHPSGRPWRTALMRPPPLGTLYVLWARDRLATALGPNDGAFLVDVSPPPTAVTLPGARGRSRAAVATSGDYVGVRKFGFHHVVSPAGLSPMKATSSSVASVSVMAASCGLADGLATAAMTYERAADAAAWLRTLTTRFPELVYGYAVLPRPPEVPYVSAAYRPVGVEPAAADGAHGKGEEGGASRGEGALSLLERVRLDPAAAPGWSAVPVPSSPDAAAIASVTVPPPAALAVLLFAVVGVDGGCSLRGAVVDTLTSATLTPTPAVSLLLPAGHAAYAAAKRATPGTELTIVLLSAADAEVAAAAGKAGGMEEGAQPDMFARLHGCPSLRLTLTSVTALPDSAVVRPVFSVLLTASVDAVRQAQTPAPLLLRSDGEVTALAPQALPPSKADIPAPAVLSATALAVRSMRPLGGGGGGGGGIGAAGSTLADTATGTPLTMEAADLRSALRYAAAAVWMVTTTAATGEALALTATSVRVPASSPGVLVFNVATSSRFGAGLGAVGSVVAAAPLRPRHEGIAARYAVSAALDGDLHFVFPSAVGASSADSGTAGEAVDAVVATAALPPLMRDCPSVVATVVAVRPAGDHLVVVAQSTRAVLPPTAGREDGHLVWLLRQYQRVGARGASRSSRGSST